jgi:hypothetical protein
MEVCGSALSKCLEQRVRQYGLTRFVLLYLVSELLKQSNEGQTLLEEPAIYLRTKQVNSDRGQLEADLKNEIAKLASYVVTELNYYIEDHGKDAYDYKSDFKSEKSVKTIRSEVLKSYEKDRFRDKVDAFTLPVNGKPKSTSGISKKAKPKK